MSRIFIMMKFIMFHGNSQAAALMILHFNEDIRGSALGATAPSYKIPRGKSAAALRFLHVLHAFIIVSSAP